ncbi:MAG: hypothetical protein LBT68_05860 [Spirochaetales bacterium]|jgi:hypothetical protein|nr:hypothetical protein [Spirochaetales bacterium]
MAADKRGIWRTTLFTALLFCAALVCAPAQDAGISEPPEAPPLQDNSSSYYILSEEGVVRFIQRIEWPAQEYVYRYEIAIERKDAHGAFHEVLLESVESNYIEVSIPVGDYRYQIKIYNLLDKLDGESDWQEFSVFLALQPELDDVFPPNMYLDEYEERRIVLEGTDLADGADIFLVPTGAFEDWPLGKPYTGARLSPRRKEFTPLMETASILFEENELLINTYDVVIQNPGDLHAHKGTVRIAFMKPRDLNVALGYSALIPVYGSSFKEYYTSPVYPLGVSGRATFIFHKQPTSYYGVEFAPYLNLVSQPEDNYTINSQVTGAMFNFVYQKPYFEKKLRLTLRAGGGIGAFHNVYVEYTGGYESEKFTTWFPALGAGVSFQWYFTKRFFVDLGMDYQHFFAKAMPSGYVFPSLLAGWQF